MATAAAAAMAMGATTVRGNEDPAEDAADKHLLPPGWKAVQRHAPSGRKYKQYEGPTGQKASSRPHAWRVFDGVASAALTRTPRGSSGEEAGEEADDEFLVAQYEEPRRIPVGERVAMRMGSSPWLSRFA